MEEMEADHGGGATRKPPGGEQPGGRYQECCNMIKTALSLYQKENLDARSINCIQALFERKKHDQGNSFHALPL